MSSFAPYVFPVPDRFINLGKEISPGSVAASTYTFPMTTWKPTDKYTRLEDTAWRNAMAQLYNLIGGVRISDISCGGPLFADGIGYPLLNIFGDYYQGIGSGTVGASTQLSVSSSIGAGTIVVSSASGISANDIISIGGTATTACEVRKVTSVTGSSPGTLVLNANLYQAHSSSASSGTVQYWSGYGNILHTFALQNIGLGAGGWTQSQPPTYTYYDYTGVPASTGTRLYSYSVFSEVTITGDATALVMWDGKITALASAIAASTPTVQTTPVIPQASWLTTVSVAGAGTLNDAQYKLTLSRKVTPKFTNSNQQDPYAIPRGYFTAGLSLDFDPLSDELEYIDYLQNSQPTLEIISSNGLAGTLSASITINAQQIGFTEGAYEDSKDVFGLTETVKCIANTVNVGPSGGYGPVSVTLANAVINY